VSFVYAGRLRLMSGIAVALGGGGAALVVKVASRLLAL
jgi:hypothetical protein